MSFDRNGIKNGFVFAEHCGSAIDEIWNNADGILKWLMDLVIQTKEESKIKKDYCEVCNLNDDIIFLQNHHVAGEKHSHITITVCKSCHQELTAMQMVWDFRWRKSNQPEEIQQGFVFLGLHDILELKTRKTGNSSYRVFAKYALKTAAACLNYEKLCKVQFI